MTQPPAEDPGSIRTSAWRWWVCGLLLLATTLNYMDRMTLNQTAVRIQNSLGIGDKEYSLLESRFSLAFAIGAVTTGFIVDRVSVRWVYPFMVLGWSAAGVLTGYANGFMMLLFCRFALGLFEAGNWPCGIRTTRTVLAPPERSLGNSLFQSGTALGAVITPLLVLAILRWADPEEPARNAFLAVAGGAGVAVTGMPADTWQVPFRVIGSIGFLWIVLWFVTVPRQAFAPPDEGKAGTAADARFVAVFLDRRFWVLFAMTVAINITWHGYRTWLPLYLQRQRGFTEAEMSWFLTAYYLAADVGSWTVGGVTLILARRGMTVHGSRKTAYAACAGLTLMSLLVPFLPNGLPLQAALLMLAFGALGLFPTYFALSQELSGRHQGKVTGTLGMCAHFSLFLIYPVEGAIVEWAKPSPVAFGLVWYEPVLGLVGLVPLLAFLFLLWQWPRGE